jgi:hypothetical protein
MFTIESPVLRPRIRYLFISPAQAVVVVLEVGKRPTTADSVDREFYARGEWEGGRIRLCGVTQPITPGEEVFCSSMPDR